MKKMKIINIINDKLDLLARELHGIKRGDKRIPYLRGQYEALVELKNELL